MRSARTNLQYYSRRADIHQTDFRENIPESFNMSQNYPNPFNPSTKINYELQIANYVTLNIYDINGKLVKELVNEKQSAGSYSIDFDGSGLPSGTYIYRLQAGDYSETKKMVLLKQFSGYSCPMPVCDLLKHTSQICNSLHIKYPTFQKFELCFKKTLWLEICKIRKDCVRQRFELIFLKMVKVS